jgi:3-deoxy-D-manno-octulosonic-acid transferase
MNARMSARSYRRWRLMPGAARALLRLFQAAQAQDDVTATRLARLGLPRERLAVTGTLKEGSSALPFDEAERAEFARIIGRRTVWLASSTHPGEEEAAARAHREVLRRAPRTLLILVPRHPERGAEIAAELREHGWRTAQRAAGEPLRPDTEIYVADTLGELGLWYRLAPISFVGGSLVPTGGHNPFEPAALGSAILHGPHVANFRDIYDRLTAAHASRLVRTPAELAAAVVDLLAPDRVATMAHAAWETCSSGAEVTDKAIELVFDSLGTGG